MADLVELTSRATDASGSGMDPKHWASVYSVPMGPQKR
jgi:hypothetical protein